MKILLIGNGAREHIIAEKLALDAEVYTVMSRKNPAIARISKKHWVCDIENAAEVARTLANERFDLGFASPDATLAAGVSDRLAEICTHIASPSKAASRIEWDKAYMRSLMERHKIGGAIRHRLVRDGADARRTIEEYGSVAIKPLGLTGGKGVRVTGDHFQTTEQGMEYVRSLLAKDKIALIEEKIEGEEFSFQCFSDGTRISVLPPVQDHKRAFVHDRGPNTGGMGSYSTGSKLPFLEDSDIEQAKKILQDTVTAMKKEGDVVPAKGMFVGVLYGQFMATKNGVKVIEYNARFGDPEAMNVLALLDDQHNSGSSAPSLAETLLSMAEGKLRPPKFSDDCTVVKYLVPDGYPDKPVKDKEVKVDENAVRKAGAAVYAASVYENVSDGKTYTSGSRAVGILGRAKTLDEAEDIAERACGFVTGPVWHREDIGTKELVEKRIAHMRKIRGK